MPLDEADLKRIWDMLAAAEQVAAYTRGLSEADFLADRMRQHAVERCVEIIGEAARNVSRSARAQVPELAWNIIVGTRHILAHDYGTIDQTKIWSIASVHVPLMIATLAKVVQENPPGPESAHRP
jgi:uncharacterized protein with HEPN domain